MRLRRLLVVVVLALLIAEPALMFADVKTSYFLPKSVITLTGTLTTKNRIKADGTEKETATSSVNVGLSTVADPKATFYLSSEAALLAKTTLTVQTGTSGLLTNLNSKSEGQLGTIIKNIFGAVVTLAKLGTGTVMDAGTTAEALYELQNPTDAGRRKALKATVAEAVKTLAEVEAKAIATEDPKARKLLRERITDLKDSLTNVRQELQLADAHFAAWKARTEDAQERRFEYVLDVDSLPNDRPFRELIEQRRKAGTPLTLSEVQKLAGSYQPILDATRVLLTQTIDEAKPVPLPSNRTADGAYYRVPRPTVISVYYLNADNQLILQKQSAELVVGENSPLELLPLQNSKWTTKQLQAEFGGGLLTKISTESGSAGAAASEVIAALPSDYLAALKKAGEINAEREKLASSAVQTQIDRLKKQKELAEARIATRESSDVAEMQALVKRIEAQISVLDAQRDLAEANTTGDQLAAMTLQQKMLKLENELMEAEIKRADLQRQIEELRRKVGGGRP